MRGLIVITGGHIYVTDDQITLDRDNDLYVSSLATGGKVQIPSGNLLVFESFADHEMDPFRVRLQQLQDERAARL